MRKLSVLEDESCTFHSAPNNLGSHDSKWPLILQSTGVIDKHMYSTSHIHSIGGTHSNITHIINSCV